MSENTIEGSLPNEVAATTVEKKFPGLLEAIKEVRRIMKETGVVRVSVNLGYGSDSVTIEEVPGQYVPTIVRLENEV